MGLDRSSSSEDEDSIRNTRRRNHVKRLKGKKFVVYKKIKGKLVAIEKPERKMGPRCESRFCKNTTVLHCDTVPDGTREAIFKCFWKLKTLNLKKAYLLSMIEEVPVKQRKGDGNSRRGFSFDYYLCHGTVKLKVCRGMFLNTFGVRAATLTEWRKEIPKSYT